MTKFVIDAPALLRIVTDALPVDPAHQLVAPSGVRSQALELLLGEVEAGRLTEREALDLHDRMTELKMRLLGDRVSRRTAWRLARELNLSIPDAEYLAIARLQADALVTTSQRLEAAASGVLPLATLDDLGRP